MKRLLPFFLFFFCNTEYRCGTETGNPNVTPPSLGSVDLSGALMFFSGSTEVVGNAKLLTRTRAQSTSSEGLGDASLLKLTLAGEVEPAIRVKETEIRPPTVLRMTKIGDDYFMLMDGKIALGEDSCTLLRITLGDQAECIDSSDHPAEPRAENGKLTFPNDQIQFLVAEKNGGILYRDVNRRLQFRGTAGISRFGPSNWSYETNFQGEDGSIYGAGCLNLQNQKTYLECEIKQGSVAVFSDVVEDDRRALPLENDQVLILGDSSDPQSLHLHEGTMGVTIDATNFSLDYTPGLETYELEITENIVSVFRIPPPIIWAGTYAVSESDDHSVCVYELGVQSIGTGVNCAANGYKTFGGIDLQQSRMIFSWMKDHQTCQLLRYKLGDPPGAPTSPYYESLLDCEDIDALPETIRFIDDGVFVFGGPEKGANPQGYRYYRYDLSTGEYELLLTSAKSLVFFPL